MRSEKEIREKIAILTSEGKKWNQQAKDILDGKTPAHDAYMDMVIRQGDACWKNVAILEWVLNEKKEDKNDEVIL